MDTGCHYLSGWGEGNFGKLKLRVFLVGIFDKMGQ
jgi:hypothetical protein